ncbi:MAG: histidinol-phosphate transaminase [Actinobacteria bacterium]|jgi:histidinol-phosphate aminotransferase|nr:histidinol-phosphate transaminase [Actinomycetota bacterium]
MRLNPVLDKLTPYRAGPPVTAIQRRYGLDTVVRLSANEIPWGPFPEVIEALKRAVEGLNRYPDGSCEELRGLLAERLSVPEESFMFGNGSCELLMLLGQAFLSPSHHVVIPHPSFVMYRSIAMMNGAPFSAVHHRDLVYDLDAMLAAIRNDTSLLIVCNPDNPTGGYLEPPILRAFLDRIPEDVVVVLDEAYGEFVTSPARQESAVWLSEYPNLVILRTFSKIYGLAGLRIGYGIADRQVVQALDKVRQPFNVDSLAQIAASESLRRPERMEERRWQVAAERDRLASRLTDMGIGCRPSQANFLLVDVTDLRIPGPEAPQALLERGVLTRSGYAMDCPGWIRVTIGEVEEGDLFLAAMQELRDARGPAKMTHPVAGLSAETLSPES